MFTLLGSYAQVHSSIPTSTLHIQVLRSKYPGVRAYPHVVSRDSTYDPSVVCTITHIHTYIRTTYSACLALLILSGLIHLIV